jgi:hypothetical protein
LGIRTIALAHRGVNADRCRATHLGKCRGNALLNITDRICHPFIVAEIPLQN